MSDQNIGLTPEEVQYLTGYSRSSKQMQALIEMGISHMVRPNGTLFVPRSAIEDVASSPPTPQQPKLNLV